MDEGHIRKAFGRGVEEGATHDTEFHEYLVHVQMAQYGSASSGGVVPGGVLFLDDDDVPAATLNEGVGQRGPCDARSDDDHICAFHAFPMVYCRSCRLPFASRSSTASG